MMTSGYPTARAASTLSGLAILSPLAGMAVEIALAWRFGASPTVDAFRIGALLLMFGQQLFVIQILPYSIVPIFMEYQAKGQEKEAWRVAFSLANILTVSAAAISLLVVLYPDPVVDFLGPGLVGEARGVASAFVRVFLPTYVLLTWSGVAAGVLYAHKVFWVPPVAHLAGNIILVLFIVGMGRVFGATSLIFGVLASSLVGTLLFVGALIRLMRRAGARPNFSCNVAHPGVRKALRLALPLLATVLLAQWAAVVMNRVLSELPSGTLSLFGYAWKLVTAVSLVPSALALVLFPRLAEIRSSLGEGDFGEISARALRMALFMAIPLTCILYVQRASLITLLFQRGAFSLAESESVARLYGLLLLGAPAGVALVYMEKIFYALQDMWLPALGKLAGAALLTVVAPVVTVQFGAGGLALLYVSFLWLTAAGLLVFLIVYHKLPIAGELVPYAAGVFFLAAGSAWVGREVGAFLGKLSNLQLLSVGLVAVGGLAAGGVVFFLVAMAARVGEAMECGRYLRWQWDAIARRWCRESR